MKTKVKMKLNLKRLPRAAKNNLPNLSSAGNRVLTKCDFEQKMNQSRFGNKTIKGANPCNFLSYKIYKLFEFERFFTKTALI